MTPMSKDIRRTTASIALALAAVLGLALAGPAQASQSIESFRTGAIENQQPLPEGLGEVVAEGFAQGAPSGNEFSVISRTGQVKTVEVSSSTTYIDPVVPKPRLSDIAVGFYITVFGEVTGPATVIGNHVAIDPPQAGGHPDLSTSFTLGSPGEPEAARNVIFRAPEGIFGNPNAVTECTSGDFALDQCPSNSQVGVITLNANYEDDPNFLLGTAPIFMVTPVGEDTALLAFVVPILNIPISVPVTVRTASDYGLTFTVSNISQLTPLAGARSHDLGIPGSRGTRRRTLPERAARAAPSNCAGLPDTGCLGQPTPVEHPCSPAHRQPDDLHREAADHDARSRRPTGIRHMCPRDSRNTRKPSAATWRSSHRSSTRARRRPKPTRRRASTSISALPSSSALPPRLPSCEKRW